MLVFYHSGMKSDERNSNDGAFGRGDEGLKTTVSIRLLDSWSTQVKASPGVSTLSISFCAFVIIHSLNVIN